MTGNRQFLLIGEAGNYHIQIGDTIEIIDAYQRQNLNIALANNFRINGRYRSYCVSEPYTKKLKRIGPVRGEIVQVCREEQDLTIIVAAG